MASNKKESTPQKSVIFTYQLKKRQGLIEEFYCKARNKTFSIFFCQTQDHYKFENYSKIDLTLG